MRKKQLFFIAVIVALVIFIFYRCSGPDTLTKDNIEDRIEDASDGEMKLSNVTSKKGKAIYETISADIDEKLSVVYFLDKKERITGFTMTNKAYVGQMNEIDFGNLAKYADVFIQVMEPDLSEEERDDILNKQLDYQNAIMYGSEEKKTETENATYTFVTGNNLYIFGMQPKNLD